MQQASSNWRIVKFSLTEFSNIWEYVDYGYNYGYLGTQLHSSATPMNPTSAKIGSLKQPSKMVMLAESAAKNNRDRGSYAVGPAYGATVAVVWPNHGSSLAVCWADGHVSSVKSAGAQESLSMNLYAPGMLNDHWHYDNRWTRDGNPRP